MLQLSLVQPHIFRLIVAFPSNQVLVFSSNLSVLQYGLNFELHVRVDFYGRDVRSQPIVSVWPEQARVENVMDVPKGLAMASSRQVQLVRRFANLLKHSEGSYEAVLQFSWSL